LAQKWRKKAQKSSKNTPSCGVFLKRKFLVFLESAYCGGAQMPKPAAKKETGRCFCQSGKEASPGL